MQKLVLIILALCLISPSCGTMETGEVEISFFDIGYGDSILIKTPDEGFFLIDTGYPEAGEKLIGLLADRGVKTLEYLIVTHPHPDHLGNAVEMARKFRPKRLRDNGEKIDRFDERLTEEMAQKYRRNFRGHPSYETLKTGDRIELGSVTLTVIWPSGIDPERDWNANSLAFMLEYQGFRALLAGDINRVAEQPLLEEETRDVKAELLKVGHHGAGDATGPEFLKAVSPRWAVISVGDNPWGYPSEAVIRRIEESGAKVYRTDRDGTITVTVRADGQTVISNQ